MMPIHIVRLIGLLADSRGVSRSTVGKAAGGSGDFCRRLEDGRDITTRKAARVAQWLSDHWPADLEWPSDIPRPAPATEDEAA